MGEMFFEDPLPFGKILADLQELEAAINARR
jgi:hypothetical protein